MITQLDSLKKLSTIVADTGDLIAIKKYKAMAATTNPSIILKSFDNPVYKSLITSIIKEAKKEKSANKLITYILDKLSVAIGYEISKIIPGRVSTEIAAELSYDIDASINKAHYLIDLYKYYNVYKNKVLIKLASTWEGIRAAEILEKEGIKCNLTLLFSDAQVRACLEARVFLISPFVGRITDWYKKKTGNDYFIPENDPGVKFVKRVCKYTSDYAYDTIVMGASFRNTGQILDLAGCNCLTISPQLLDDLDKKEGEVKCKIYNNKKYKIKKYKTISEDEFNSLHSNDQMAKYSLYEGINKFSEDQEKLKKIIKELL
ncbi:Transaldolase [Candidatus Johnevansia muelleri]|uniref:transaldolase n=1 Tax=Candidatus Johnevansia muelleri TaxID=1495769 RepID=A0A078KH76_9GAMM|nr:Transaldolase [Candidatus Evansia muelleri]